MSPTEQRKLEAKLLKKLNNPFKKWLAEDVAYIVFPQERLAFLQLKTDAEREEYIRQFWGRRDPTPETLANEWRDEHYRRIEYANLHFTAGVKGWRTDRGFLYIVYGPPDEVQRNEGPWLAPEGNDARIAGAVAGGISRVSAATPVAVYPFQKWRYRYIDGIGFNVELEFVDRTGSGRFELAGDIGEKFEVVPVPGGLFDAVTLGLIPSDLTFQERMDLRNKRIMQKVNQGKLLEASPDPGAEKKLPEEVVTSRLVRNLLPFQMRIDSFRGRNQRTATMLVLGFQKGDLGFSPRGELRQAMVRFRGSVTDRVGRPVAVLQQSIEWSASAGWLEAPGLALFEKQIELLPGRYQLALEMEDPATGKQARIEQPLEVPDFSFDRLTTSSLVFARASAAREKPGGIQKATEPSLDGRFSRSEKAGIYLQVYGLLPCPEPGKPNGMVTYVILQGDHVVFQQQEVASVPEGKALTLTKSISLSGVQPGEYRLRITITDATSKQAVEAEAALTVTP